MICTKRLSRATLSCLCWAVACQQPSQSASDAPPKPTQSKRADDAERGDRAEHADKGKHAEHGEEPARVVRLSPAAVERVGIRLATVEAAAIAGGLTVPAEIVAEPDRVAHVSSVVSGQISRVSASVGDRVKAGQILTTIRSVALGAARADAARARVSVDVAQTNFRRQQELKREGIGAQRHFLEARAELSRAQAELTAAERALEVYGRGGSGSEVRLRSPIAGRVVSRHATVGEVVSPSDVLFEITDISKVWAVGRVYQQNAGQLKEGMAATLTLQALPGRTFAGQLDYVAPRLDEVTRTLPIHMTLDNPEGLLRPGLFGNLSLRAMAERDAQGTPIVRVSALQRVGSDTVVFTPGAEPGEFHAISVGVGSRSGGVATVISGLSVGARYVADGAFVLKSELSRDEIGHAD